MKASRNLGLPTREKSLKRGQNGKAMLEMDEDFFLYNLYIILKETILKTLRNNL